MKPAATLYAGRVAHIRHIPFRHRFDYRIWMMCADIDRLDEIGAGSMFFSHDKPGLISIQDKDHGFRDGRPLRGFVEAALARQNLQEFGRRIDFVTTPRLLGYAFNPISFFLCHDADGRLGAVLHQVKNTFGDQIGYLMPVTGSGPIRQSAPKRMHVSPFFDMQGGYRFALTPPDKNFTVSIQYGAAGQKRMTATMILQARPFGNAAILRLLAEMPLAPMKVIAAIHWQALKLYLRGAVFHGVPEQKHEAIIAGEGE
jgi:DUF1365 family protein